MDNSIQKKIFLCLACLLSVFYLLLLIYKKFPVAHDTFQYFQLQYIFYNEIFQNKSIALWLPFMNQGMLANFYFMPQLSILSPVIYLSALLDISVNYYYIFLANLYFEELFFLFGVLKLASIYFKDKRVVFFVCLSALGSTICYPQVWWNFHIFYFIPISLYLLHKFLDTGKIFNLAAAVVFYMLTIFGNFIYCGLFTSFVFLLYLVQLFYSEPQKFKDNFLSKQFLKKTPLLILLFSVIIVSLGVVYFGASEMRYPNEKIASRNSDGKITINNFLNYGGSKGFKKYSEIFDRRMQNKDINLYAGYLLFPLIIIALFYSRRKYFYALLGLCTILFLFSAGTFVSRLYYYLYPYGSMFRHIGLTATVLKLFLIFLAAFGLEAYIVSFRKKYIHLVFMVSLLVVAAAIVSKATSLSTQDYWFLTKLQDYVSTILPSVLIVLTLLVLMFAYRNYLKLDKAILLIIVFAVFDLALYKYILHAARMPPYNSNVIKLFKPYKYKYSNKRQAHTAVYFKNNERAKVLLPYIFYHHMISAYYNTLDSFFYTDSANSVFRTDFILKPLGPLQNDKKKIAQVIKNPKLMLLKKIDSKILDFSKSEGEIEVKQYSFNSIAIDVNVKDQNGAFLYYADVYHPFWKVYINNKEMQLLKANIAYKAVKLPYGKSKVIFKFGNFFQKISLVACLFLLSLMLLIYLKMLFDLVCSKKLYE